MISYPSKDSFNDFISECTAQIASVPDNLRHALPSECLTEVDRLSCDRSFLTLAQISNAIVSPSHSLISPTAAGEGRRAVCPHCLKPNRQLETEEGNFARSRDEGTTAAASLYLTFEYIASSLPPPSVPPPLPPPSPPPLSLQHYLEESVRELYGGIIKFARRNEGRQGEVDGRQLQPFLRDFGLVAADDVLHANLPPQPHLLVL